MDTAIWQTNEGRMAVNSVCDGLRMLWRDLDSDQLQLRLGQLTRLIVTCTETDPAKMDKQVKVKVLRGAGERSGGLVSVQLTGEAARVFGFLPWAWAFSLHQVHFKTYADETFLGATDGFANTMFMAEQYGALSFFSGKKEGNRPKDSGSKGTRIGSRKSDVHTIVYKRKNERTGVETRVQDKVLNRLVNEVDQIEPPGENTLSDAIKYGALHRKAALFGFRRFLNELRRRGVKFTDYFSTVTPHPTGAVYNDATGVLDPREEGDEDIPF